ncbi:hypothetical protein V1512DRAFT_264812 [Lipomyces arxii]|uniref:uncharacterized protein n=1 Tax=Lipomyces arxii TaxID=56418 RepID=UPI0034CF453D
MAARVRLRPPPNADFILGYPGINATWPRVAGVIELRPEKIGQTFRLVSLKVQLMLTESVLSRRSSLKKAVTEKKYKVGKEHELYKAHPGSATLFHAIDLPFTYSLPFVPEANMPPSMTIDDLCEIKYDMRVYIVDDTRTKPREAASCPITIIRYDSIRLFRALSKPTLTSTEIFNGSNLCTITVSTEFTSYGPSEPIDCTVRILRDPSSSFYRRPVTVQEIKAKIIQSVKYRTVNGEINDTKLIADNDKTKYVQIKLEGNEFSTTIVLQRFSTRKPEEITQPFINMSPGVPNSLAPTVSLTGNTISVEFYLSVKVKMSGCRDVELQSTLIMNHFDGATLEKMKIPINESLQEVRRIGDDRRGFELQQPRGTFVPYQKDGGEALLNFFGITKSSEGTHVKLE